MQDSPNRDLLGQPGSRDRLQTPCLVLDLDAAEANIAAMAAHARAADIGLRPHAKAHKSVELARRQLAAGANGICVATVGEAEALAAGGVTGLLLTSPLAAPAKAERLAALCRGGADAMAAIDDAEAVEELAQAMAAPGGGRGVQPRTPVVLTLLVDIDVGQHRTGVPDADTALQLARRIDAAPGLRFGGIQAYAGHVQHIAGLAERHAAMAGPWALLQEVCRVLTEAGLPPAIVTGAGTGTHGLDAAAGHYSELQAGSYVFTDVQYDAVALREDRHDPFRPSLFVACAVISWHQPGFVTTDGGLKRFATDGPAPRPVRNAPPGARFKFSGDEFGALILGDTPAPARGTVIECQVPHCDPNVDLYDWYHVVQGDRLVALWPVDGRGAI